MYAQIKSLIPLSIKNGVKRKVLTPQVTGLLDTLNIRPLYHREVPAGASVSDLFAWRSSEKWQTRFELVNLSSIAFPETPLTENVRLYILGSDGKLITEEKITLEPFESRHLLISDLVSGKGYGSFLIQHEPVGQNSFEEAGAGLCERGYNSFRLQGEKVWKFVHGVMNAVYWKDGNGIDAATPIRKNFKNAHVYCPQVHFRNEVDTELFFLNPTKATQWLGVSGIDEKGKRVFTTDYNLRAFESAAVSLPKNKGICRVEARSKVYLWRPLIFNYYKDTFDVFHS